MTLQTTASSGDPLNISEIKTEFGSSSTLLTSYYRGGGLVPNHEANAAIPASGSIKVLDFLGADKTFRCTINSGTYSTGGIVPATYYGYSTNLDGFTGTSFGSLSGYTYFGVSSSSLDQATIGGIYCASFFVVGPGGGGGGGGGPGGFVYVTALLLVGGDYTTTANWTSMTLTQTASVTLTRAAATSVTYYASGNYTKYTWATQTLNATGAVTMEIS